LQKKTKTARADNNVSNLTLKNADTEALEQEEREICKKIDEFFTAMKLLQKAVNKKEDISELKVEFETKQRSL
jgi:hypothetical protein